MKKAIFIAAALLMSAPAMALAQNAAIEKSDNEALLHDEWSAQKQSVYDFNRGVICGMFSKADAVEAVKMVLDQMTSEASDLGLSDDPKPVVMDALKKAEAVPAEACGMMQPAERAMLRQEVAMMKKLHLMEAGAE